MSNKLNVVLIWAERIATAVSIAVPAIRKVVSILGAKPEVAVSSDD